MSDTPEASVANSFCTGAPSAVFSPNSACPTLKSGVPDAAPVIGTGAPKPGGGAGIP